MILSLIDSVVCHVLMFFFLTKIHLNCSTTRVYYINKARIKIILKKKSVCYRTRKSGQLMGSLVSRPSNKQHRNKRNCLQNSQTIRNNGTKIRVQRNTTSKGLDNQKTIRFNSHISQPFRFNLSERLFETKSFG